MAETIRDWLGRAEARLAPLIGAEEARRDVRLLLRHATGRSAAALLADAPVPLAETERNRADAMLERRVRREPTAQILGHWPFHGRDFEVGPAVLTPRPDTETLVDLALSAPFASLLDLGTGSGALAVTLLAERPDAHGVATDISAAALEIAGRNARRHRVEGRLDLRQGDWWQAVPEGRAFDLIVSNPPYVSAAEYAGLAPEITRFEPQRALTPGGDGLGAYRAILEGARPHLAPGGRLIVEIGAGQGAAVRALFLSAGLDAVRVDPDLTGKDRVVRGRRPASGGKSR